MHESHEPGTGTLFLTAAVVIILSFALFSMTGEKNGVDAGNEITAAASLGSADAENSMYPEWTIHDAFIWLVKIAMPWTDFLI